MKKFNAIEYIEAQEDINLDNKNVIFSSITSKIGYIDAYWFEPKNIRFQRDIYLILDNRYEKKLYFFKIPEKSIHNPDKIFYQRKDKKSSSIKIRCDDKSFIDMQSKNRFSFLPYFQRSFEYS